MPRPLLALLSVLLAFLAAPPVAGAGWFAPDVVDGPGPILSVSDLDVARDGTGALVYLREDGGVPHVFLTRLTGGAWQPPVRVDAGVDTAASAASLGVADGGRLAVAFASGNKLYGASVQGGADQVLSGPRLLFADADPARALASLDVDMGNNGTAYVGYAVGAGAAFEVAAARLEDDRWDLVPSVLDIAPAEAAGQGARRPRVAVGAEGNALVSWGETHPDGRGRVYARRIAGLTVSAAPQEVSVPSLGGVPAGEADSPEIAIEEDGSFAWVVFRQDVGGVSRSIARRLIGSLFEPPVAIDGGNPSRSPDVAINGAGVGYAVTALPDASVWGALLERDVFAPATRLDTTGSVVDPMVATSDRRTNVVAWRRAGTELWAREREEGGGFGAETRLTAPEFGPLAGAFGVGVDRVGDAAVGFVQGAPGARRLLVASWDRPPGLPVGRTTTRYLRKPQPTLRWAAGTSLWGPLSYQVVIDGVDVGSSAVRRFSPPTALADGVHQWFVRSIDRRGQVTVGKPRALRIDTVAPVVEVSRRGQRRARRTLRFAISATDGTLSGVKKLEVDFGDETPRVTRRGATLNVRHAYARRGRYVLTVRAVDRAGNATVETVALRIRRR